MKAQFTIGRFGGVPISIHWTFLLILIWIVFINIFSAAQSAGIVWSILLFFSLFVSLFAQELGYAIMARFFNARISSILLLPTGPIDSYKSLPKKRGQQMLILMAGPLINLFMAAVLSSFINPFQAYWDAPENIGNASQSNFLFQWQILNLSLFIFNLIPAFPFAGGGILRILLTYRMGNEKASKIVHTVSKLIGFASIVMGIASVTLLFILLGSFILFTSGTTRKYHESIKSMSKRFIFSS